MPTRASPLGWDSLPPEIKDKIYRSLFIVKRSITPGQPISLSAQILRCNKATYHEAHSLLWLNTFLITSGDLVNPTTTPQHMPLALWWHQLQKIQLEGGCLCRQAHDNELESLGRMPKLESIDMVRGENPADSPLRMQQFNSDETLCKSPRIQTDAMYSKMDMMRRLPAIEFYLSTTRKGAILLWRVYLSKTDPLPLLIFLDRTPCEEFESELAQCWTRHESDGLERLLQPADGPGPAARGD